jgi:hypothetical protein
MHLKRMLLIGGTALALVAGGTAAGAAIASGPVDSSGVVHGCYTVRAVNGSHALVLQDEGTSCPNGTTAVTWNQTGPQGTTGPTGPQGPAGPQGAPGATGPAGVTGYQIEICDLNFPNGSTNTGVSNPQLPEVDHPSNPLCTLGFADFRNTQPEATLLCPSGKTAISGGYQLSQAYGPNVTVLNGMAPTSSGSGYKFDYFYSAFGNPNSQPIQDPTTPAVVYVTCALTS